MKLEYNQEERLFNVGDVIYRINKNNLTGPFKTIITRVEHHALGHYTYHFGKDYLFGRMFNKTYFKTQEEAMDALETATIIKRKRELLKEYEVKLNEELGLENHRIVK